jgi:pyruvate kinase
MSRHRPTVPVLCLSHNVQTARQLALSYAVRPFLAKDITNFDDIVSYATTLAQKSEFATKNDRLVITAGVPFGTSGSTNALRIAKIKE